MPLHHTLYSAIKEIDCPPINLRLRQKPSSFPPSARQRIGSPIHSRRNVVPVIAAIDFL